MLRTNLRGQIRQTPLPKWKALLPLFEAIMNSFQAVQDLKVGGEHKIVVVMERERGLLNEDDPPVAGFEVHDTGVGFNDENFEWFNAAYSEHKVDRGGKGLGRFMWLKAFEFVEVVSVFSSEDEEGAFALWKREFRFDLDYDPEKGMAVRVANQPLRTIVRTLRFSNAVPAAMSACHRSARTTASGTFYPSPDAARLPSDRNP